MDVDNNNTEKDNTENALVFKLLQEFRTRMFSSTSVPYTVLLNELLEKLRYCNNDFRKTVLNHFTTKLHWKQDDDDHGQFTQDPTSQQILDELDYLASLLSESKKSAPYPLEAFMSYFGDTFQYEVFICHAGEQYVLASSIYNKLFAAGIRTFLDCKSFHPGQPLQGLFDDFLRLLSSAAIIILSQDFYSSEWTLKELELMKQKAKKDPNFILVVIPTIQTDQSKATLDELSHEFQKQLHIIENQEDVNNTALFTRELLESRVPHHLIPCRYEGCNSLAEVGFVILNNGAQLVCNYHGAGIITPPGISADDVMSHLVREGEKLLSNNKV